MSDQISPIKVIIGTPVFLSNEDLGDYRLALDSEGPYATEVSNEGTTLVFTSLGLVEITGTSSNGDTDVTFTFEVIEEGKNETNDSQVTQEAENSEQGREPVTNEENNDSENPEDVIQGTQEKLTIENPEVINKIVETPEDKVIRQFKGALDDFVYSMSKDSNVTKEIAARAQRNLLTIMKNALALGGRRGEIAVNTILSYFKTHAEDAMSPIRIAVFTESTFKDSSERQQYVDLVHVFITAAKVGRKNVNRHVGLAKIGNSLKDQVLFTNLCIFFGVEV